MPPAGMVKMMAVELTLKDQQDWICPEVTGYELPEHQPGVVEFDYDADWLKLRCRRYMGRPLPEGETLDGA